MESQPFLLVELEDLSTIFAPLKTTTRIKYTCFNVSNNYLIFGATSGGLYIFRREPCCFLQLLPNKEGSVTQVSISPDEKLVAFSTIKGIVCILERTSHGSKQLVTTFEHQNEQVTCLQWNERNDELYVGDTCGKVSIVTVSIFPTKSMFQTPSFVLMQLDSKIVQMDFHSNMLLVSTLTKCYICDTKREIFRQVGHKLRDGEFGACIFNTHLDHSSKLDSCKNETDKKLETSSSLSHLKLLCARPGSRVWEVAIDGTVISTHQFKEALAIAPRKIYFLSNSSSQNSCLDHSITNGTCTTTEIINSNFVEQSFNFQKLFIILYKFLFTFKNDGIYIFDPQKASVILWNNEITNIVDVKCINDLIYIWTGCGKMFALNLIPLEKYIVRLYFQKRYSELVKLCLEFESFLLSQANNCSKLYILHDLDEKYKSDIIDRLKPLIDKFKENAQNRKTQNAQKLKSGIYLVSNNDEFLLDDKRLLNSKLRPNYLNLKGRSHSVSPERFQNGGMNHRGSSSSLPDLVKERKEDEYENEIVVNGKEKAKVGRVEVKTEEVVGLCQKIRNAETPSDELAFSVFDQILVLGSVNGLDLVQSLPLKSFFSEEDVKLISDLFHSCLKSKSIFKWLEKFSGDWLTAVTESYPNFLAKNQSVQVLEIDYKLSKILELFSSVLRENQIIDLIKQTGMECYYGSLVRILSVFHDSSLSSASSSLFDISSPPKILNKVYFLLNVGQIDQISKYSSKLNLQDVLYLMLKFEETSKKLGKSCEIIELQCHTLFLSYLEKAPEGFKLIAGCSDLVENYVINCLENINSAATCTSESSCPCGFPCPCLQTTIKMFPDIGHALIDKTWHKNPTKCLEICNKVPYLWKYLIFIRRNEELDAILPLIIQLGEIQELENRWKEVKEGHLEDCIRYLILLKQGNCLNCNEKIKNEYYSTTWTEFGLLCVKLLGPLETLEFFRKYSEDISSAELNQSFFQGVIFSFIMEKHSKGLRKNVVDLLTGKGTLESNKVSVLSEKLREDIIGKSSVEKFTLANNESNKHHWGIKVNLKGNCAVCSLPLNTKVLISEAGLVAFKCSHAFHAACLRKINVRCPLCENNRGE